MTGSTSDVPQTLVKLEQLRFRSDIHFPIRLLQPAAPSPGAEDDDPGRGLCRHTNRMT